MHETMLYNSLFSFRVKLSKENTKHYLFDNLDGEKEGFGSGIKAAKEFTEDDLKPEESAKKEGWDFHVRSSPRKASMKDQ